MAHNNIDNEVGEDAVWNVKKVKKLLKRIRQQIPDGDCMHFLERVGRISWDEVAFKSYTPEECFEVWSHLVTKVRKYRLLDEILNDTLTWVQENDIVELQAESNATITGVPSKGSKNEKATHNAAKERHELSTGDILAAYEDGTKEEGKDQKKKGAIENNRKKTEKKNVIKKPAKVEIDSSEENACSLYLKYHKVFKSAKPATITLHKEAWKALPESEKALWLKKADKLELNQRDRLLGKSRPPTVPSTVHHYFVQQFSRKNPGLEPKLKFSSASQAWKTLGDEERNKMLQEWTRARQEAYEGAKEYLESLDPTDREAEEKHYVTVKAPAKRKRGASISIGSKPSASPKAAKRSRAKSVFSAPPEEKVSDFEEKQNRRSSKDAIRDRLKSRMRSSSEELDVNTDEDNCETEAPVSPRKMVKHAEISDKISTSTRSMSPEFLDEERVEADEPTSPVLKHRKSPRKDSVSRLNTSTRDKSPESDDFKPKSKKSDKFKSKRDEESAAPIEHIREKSPESDVFKPKSKKSDKLKLKQNEEITHPIDHIRVGGESQIDTTGEDDAVGEASYVFNNKDSAKPKVKKQKKKALQLETEKETASRLTMGETEFISHAGVTSSPNEVGNGAPLMEPREPPETPQQLYKMTSPDGEPWEQVPDKTKRRWREALRELKKKYVIEYEAYLKAQPHHVLEEKAKK